MFARDLWVTRTKEGMSAFLFLKAAVIFCTAGLLVATRLSLSALLIAPYVR